MVQSISVRYYTYNKCLSHLQIICLCTCSIVNTDTMQRYSIWSGCYNSKPSSGPQWVGNVITPHTQLDTLRSAQKYTHMLAYICKRTPSPRQVRVCSVRLCRHQYYVSLQPLLKAYGASHLHSMNTNDWNCMIRAIRSRLAECNQYRKSSDRMCDLGHHTVQLWKWLSCIVWCLNLIIL